ncbi:SH3 domain-containing protein [Ascidiimonas sp. W6]|uniref:SH3 domain-containing protein n=1 Tax=Ascidiimonas meishanensis TaxID=3128903 RepID=UPI0030EE01ED
MKKIFLIVLLLPLFSFGQNNETFNKATALYNDGKFEEAIVAYEAILADKKHSAALYYNLGNAHYKLNHIAPSIFYYEKALLLSPTDEDVLNNISFARNMAIDVIEPLPPTGFSKLIERSIGKLSYHNWAILAIVSVFLFTGLFLTYYFLYRQRLKRIAFIASFLFLGLGIFAISMAFYEYNAIQNKRPAIVFAEETIVKAEPNEGSASVFTLHEGTKVQVEESYEGWKKIRLADGKIGWLKSSVIKEIKDF